jgi:hypothetical protein
MHQMDQPQRAILATTEGWRTFILAAVSSHKIPRKYFSKLRPRKVNVNRLQNPP